MSYLKLLSKSFLIQLLVIAFIFPESIYANEVFSQPSLVDISKEFKTIGNVKSLVNYAEKNQYPGANELKKFLTEHKIKPDLKLLNFNFVNNELRMNYKEKVISIKNVTDKNLDFVMDGKSITIPTTAGIYEIHKMIDEAFGEKNTPHTTLFDYVVAPASAVIPVLGIFFGLIAAIAVYAVANVSYSAHKAYQLMSEVSNKVPSCKDVKPEEAVATRASLVELEKLRSEKCSITSYLLQSRWTSSYCLILKNKLMNCLVEVDSLNPIKANSTKPTTSTK
jgi:hypothetical protein